MLTRRRLITTGLALICAPAIVRATSLMPISPWPNDNWSVNTKDWYHGPLPALRLWGDGIHDDTEAMRAYIGGKPVYHGNDILVPYNKIVRLPSGTFRVKALGDITYSTIGRQDTYLLGTGATLFWA